MTPEEQVRIGLQAKQVLDNELVTDAFRTLEQTIIDQWSALSVENKAQAEELKRLLWASQQFKSIFTVLVANGSVAQNELTRRDALTVKEDAALQRIYGYA